MGDLHITVLQYNILFTGGSLSRWGSLSKGLCPGGVSVQGCLCPTWGLCQGGSLSRGISVQGVSVKGVSFQGVSVQGRSLSRGINVQGVSIQGISVRETPAHTVTCGRYASYWNAFLWYFFFAEQHGFPLNL